jgi:predicted phage terminase large subunit-like protein
MNFPATLRAVRDLSARWQAATAKLIEDKANGSAVIQMLQHELPGIIPVNPQGGKIARAAAISPLIEAGNVYLPHPDWAPWVWEFIEECAAFPNGKHDDQVDTMTQAILYSLSRPVYRTYQICDPVRISSF